MTADKELNAAIALMQKMIWADQAQREKLQEQGLNLVPMNFYSNTPSISEILNSYEYTEPNPPYFDDALFNQQKLRQELIDLIPFSEKFAPPENGDEENGNCFFWKNGQFCYSDPMAYYSYIRRVKPKTIIEIGSGFSSLVALEALAENGEGRLKCVEPFPRPFIKSLAGSGALDLLETRAQDITSEMLNSMLSNGDILFIDSTHTVKTGSDCLHIYLRLLPRINKKIYIHVHDVCLPFGLRQDWLLESQVFWTEQYLLLAWMIDNPRVSVLYGSAYHDHFNPSILDALMRNQFVRGGSSFWLEYDGRR